MVLEVEIITDGADLNPWRFEIKPGNQRHARNLGNMIAAAFTVHDPIAIHITKPLQKGEFQNGEEKA